MFIKLSVKANSPDPKLEKLSDNEFIIHVSASAENNMANREIISVLSKYFNTSWKNVKIKSGFTSKNKLVEIKC